MLSMHDVCFTGTPHSTTCLLLRPNNPINRSSFHAQRISCAVQGISIGMSEIKVVHVLQGLLIVEGLDTAGEKSSVALGSTGLKLSRLGLGTLQWGDTQQGFSNRFTEVKLVHTPDTPVLIMAFATMHMPHASDDNPCRSN